MLRHEIEHLAEPPERLALTRHDMFDPTGKLPAARIAVGAQMDDENAVRFQ
jgi:hypothetical protein